MIDTRLLNWQLVVPDERAPLLFLPANGESVPSATVVAADRSALEYALDLGFYHAVVAPDLEAWAASDPDGSAPALLSRLATATAPGGWVFAAFGNRWFPRRRRGGLGLRKALRILRRAGLSGEVVYVPLPSQRQPAWLVPVGRREELDVFLRQMVFPYAPVASPVLGWVATRAIQVGRRAALAAPHRLRVRFAPAYAVVARRAG